MHSGWQLFYLADRNNDRAGDCFYIAEFVDDNVSFSLATWKFSEGTEKTFFDVSN